jgi:ribose-phosphate pyrophosphokinase
MITLFNISNGRYDRHTVAPTVFPDKTSQVWKIPNIETMTACAIEWHFEQEAELIWLNQLLMLLDHYKVTVTELHIPYLPYARQDKEVDNNSTFARAAFLNMLGGTRNMYITALDMHSPTARITNICPEPYIKDAVKDFSPDVIVYPDKGAHTRYSKLECLVNFPAMIMDKTRNQATGEITGLTTEYKPPNRSASTSRLSDRSNLRYLMVDDICDGGATFIRIANYITSSGLGRDALIGLYTTHGIYSKGKSVLYEAEITYLYNSQTFNSQAFVGNK